MLHKTTKIRGFHLVATDGVIGHVDDFLIDEDWTVRYLVVDTSNFIGGKWIIIPSGLIDSIDSPHKCIKVNMTRAEVRNSGVKPSTASRVAGSEPLKMITPRSPWPHPSAVRSIAHLQHRLPH